MNRDTVAGIGLVLLLIGVIALADWLGAALSALL